MWPRPWSVQPTKTMVLPSRDQAGNSSNSASSLVTSRRALPPAVGLTHSLPRVSNTTVLPSGETLAQRGILVWNLSGAISTVGWIASMTTRVSSILNGMTALAPSATATRRILPPAQNTTLEPSGVQAMFG